jgi:hypothetical protein
MASRSNMVRGVVAWRLRIQNPGFRPPAQDLERNLLVLVPLIPEFPDSGIKAVSERP